MNLSLLPALLRLPSGATLKKHDSHIHSSFLPSLFLSLQFATGEGSVDELSGLTTKLGNFSAMVDTLENGPLKKMVLTLRDQAMAQLKDVKGAEKVCWWFLWY